VTAPDIQFATNTGFAWHPFGLGAFGADITATISVPATASYSFTLDSDDGSLLYIDGVLVVNDGNPHGPAAASGSALLTAGLHSVEVQFFEDFGGQSGVDLTLPAGVSFVAAPLPAPFWGTLVLLSLALGASVLHKIS
jgi:hypothetical protein